MSHATGVCGPRQKIAMTGRRKRVGGPCGTPYFKNGSVDKTFEGEFQLLQVFL